MTIRRDKIPWLLYSVVLLIVGISILLMIISWVLLNKKIYEMGSLGLWVQVLPVRRCHELPAKCGVTDKKILIFVS